MRCESFGVDGGFLFGAGSVAEGGAFDAQDRPGQIGEQSYELRATSYEQRATS